MQCSAGVHYAQLVDGDDQFFWIVLNFLSSCSTIENVVLKFKLILLNYSLPPLSQLHFVSRVLVLCL